MSQLLPGPMYSGAKPIRDPAYKRFIRALPCIACFHTWGIDPCHTGQHGVSQKACDYSCIPLCRQCHGEYDANPVRFAARHKLDIPTLIKVFTTFYQTKLKGDAA
jgi:hypothetical protein